MKVPSCRWNVLERYYQKRRKADFIGQEGSHRVYEIPGQARRGVIPVHAKELPPEFVLRLVKQAGGSREDFLEFLVSEK